MEYMQERLNIINSMGKIEYVAWHVRDDERRIVSVKFGDTDGKTIDIFIDRNIAEWLISKDMVLINLALQKCFKQNGINGNDYWIDFTSTLSGAVNKARQVLPYKGETWINEKRAPYYSHVVPEHVY